MTTPPVRVERRVGQRFAYLLPLSLRQISTATEGLGFTQDVSSRGVFFFTDAALQEGAEIELTLRMPSEITLGESMLVRCRGRILRIAKPTTSAEETASPAVSDTCNRTQAQTKIGVAVRFEGYEYLPESTTFSPGYARVSALHRHQDEDHPVPVAAPRPILG